MTATLQSGIMTVPENGLEPVQVYAASSTIKKGVTSSGLVVSNFDQLYVYGTLTSSLIAGGATARVSSGGLVTSTGVRDSASLIVSSGASANYITVSSAGKLEVNSGAFSYGPTVNAFGKLLLYGGSAQDIKLSGNSANLNNSSAWNATFYAGYASYLTLSSYAKAKVQSATVSSATLYANALLEVGNGGSVTYLKTSGNVSATYGATLNQITIFNSGNVTVSSGGRLANATVSSGGSAVISSGANLTSATLRTGAYLMVTGSAYGIEAAGATIEVNNGRVQSLNASSGTLIDVKSNGVASSINISGATLTATSGAIISRVYVHNTGVAQISSGAKVNGTIYAGGSAYLAEGASIHTGGLTCSSRATVNGFTFNTDITLPQGSSLLFSNAVVSSGVYANLYSGQSAAMTTVSGTMYVRSGGYLANTQIAATGSMTVYNGATARNIKFYGSGALSSGGLLDQSDILNGGYLNALNGRTTNLNISSGGSARFEGFAEGSGIIVNSGGRLITDSDRSRTLTDIKINVGGTLFLIGSNGELVTNVTVSAGGSLNGFSLKRTQVFDNLANISIGSSVVSSGANAKLYEGQSVSRVSVIGSMAVTSATVSDLFISSGGRATLVAAKTTLGAVYSGGWLSALAKTSITGGTLAGVLQVYQGASVSQLTITSGGSARISAAGNASGLTVSSGGTLDVNTSAASVTQIVLEAGGVLNGFTMNKHTEYASIGSANKYNDVSVNGNVYLNEGETADILTLNSGAYLRVKSGAKVSGKMTLGGNMYLDSGSTLNFDVAAAIPGITIVNDWSRISDSGANFTITLDGAKQRTGKYILAQNVFTFNKTITVYDTKGNMLGALPIGGVFKVGDLTCTLNKENSSLVLSVTSPVSGKAAKGDINGNNVSDVMFQYTGGDNQIGFWLDGKDKWQGQGIMERADWEVIGAYDMDSNGKADIVMLGNVVLGGIRGAYVGFRKDGDTSTWENISVLYNPDNIEWHLKVGNLTGNAGKNSIVWHAPDLSAVGVWTDGTDNWVAISGGFDRNWSLKGTGDFNGDGKDEILFENNGGFYAVGIDSSFSSLGGFGGGWDVRAIGDFNGDGKDDIVLFHKETGSIVRFEDGKAETWSSVGQLDANDWFIVGAGDYDGDGKDDLLVRQYSTGMLGYYSGCDTKKWVEMGRGVDMDWTVIA